MVTVSVKVFAFKKLQHGKSIQWARFTRLNISIYNFIFCTLCICNVNSRRVVGNCY